MGVGTLRISELLILRGSTGECGGPGSAPGGGDPQGSGGSLRPPARSYRGSGSPNSLAGMNCQTWPRAGRDEPVIIFKFAIIDLRKSCGDKDELICKFIGEINPAVIKKPPLRCRGGVPSSVPGRERGTLPVPTQAEPPVEASVAPEFLLRPGFTAPRGERRPRCCPGFPPPPLQPRVPHPEHRTAEDPPHTFPQYLGGTGSSAVPGWGGGRKSRLDFFPLYRDPPLGKTHTYIRYYMAAAVQGHPPPAWGSPASSPPPPLHRALIHLKYKTPFIFHPIAQVGGPGE